MNSYKFVYILMKIPHANNLFSLIFSFIVFDLTIFKEIYSITGKVKYDL